MNSTKKVTNTERQYKKAMTKLDVLMTKGSQNLSVVEMQEIRELALQAQQYEQLTLVVRAPQTFAGILEMKMYELKLKQKDLAQKLQISDAKLSLVISGKQKPDVELLKKVHLELDIDAHLLLSLV